MYLYNEYFEFLEKFKKKYGEELDKINIGILEEFKENKFWIKKFHEKYVENNKPKIIICGINPGRFGAGKTGIPFLDFNSLRNIFPEIQSVDKEKTATFMFEVIQRFGIDEFYNKFHLTNLSWYGFYNKTTGKNVNYNELPSHIANFLLEKFVQEVNYLKADIIIPISDIALWELTLNLKKNSKISSTIEKRLYHPSTRFAKKEEYIEMFEKFI